MFGDTEYFMKAEDADDMVIADPVVFWICTVRRHLATCTDESIPRLDTGTIVQDEIVETHFGNRDAS